MCSFLLEKQDDPDCDQQLSNACASCKTGGSEHNWPLAAAQYMCKLQERGARRHLRCDG